MRHGRFGHGHFARGKHKDWNRHHWPDDVAAVIMAMRGRGRGGRDDDAEGGGFRRGGSGWGRGGGRALGHGDLRVLVLALLAEKPRHGYDLIRAIEERFAGAYAPSPGAVYPLLTMLEEQDLIRATAEGAKKLYTLTSEGEAWIRDNEAQVQGVLSRVDIAASHYSSQTAPDEVWEAWKTLKHAMNVPRGWSEEEAERIRTILDNATRDIIGRKD
jgi:DNA-binding PadR family transcriptional regulator